MYMPNTIETIIVFCVILIILATSNHLSSIYCSNVGKVFILAAILFLAYRHVYFGVAGVLVYIYLNYTYKEGLENMEEKGSNSMNESTPNENETTKEEDDVVPIPTEENKSTSSKEDELKTSFLKHCKDGKLYDDKNNLVDLNDISSVFPNLKFTGDKCNPCNVNCGFTISTSSDRIASEESMRPIDSTTLPDQKNGVSMNVQPTQIN